MTRGARRRAFGLGALSTIAMAIYWAAAFEHAHATGYGDWQWFHHMWEAGRTAIVRWGEPPLFDPHHCGGVPLWGNPQAQVYSPTWAVTGLVFGTTSGDLYFSSDEGDRWHCVAQHLPKLFSVTAGRLG